MGLSRQEFCSGLSFPSLGDLPDTEIKPTSPVLAGRFFTTYHLGVKVTQLCLTLCNPMDYTVHEILQARILEWVAFLSSRGSSQSRDRTQVSHIAGRFFASRATRKLHEYWSG